jgi:hypothetical protein
MVSRSSCSFAGPRAEYNSIEPFKLKLPSDRRRRMVKRRRIELIQPEVCLFDRQEDRNAEKASQAGGDRREAATADVLPSGSFYDWASVPSAKHFKTSAFPVGKHLDSLPLLATRRALRLPPSSPARTIRGSRVRLRPPPREEKCGGALLTASASSGSSVLSCKLSSVATAAKPIAR